MPRFKLAFAAAALLSIGGLSSCADGYGYGGGFAQGFGGGGGGGWDPYYGGYNADPYWGWNNNFYYPGMGNFVYDRQNLRRRWNGQQRGFWQGRGQVWRGAHRQMRPMWRDYGIGGQPGRGLGNGRGRWR